MGIVFMDEKCKALDLKGYTVIVPSICVGNAAQLACDLLISSKSLSRVACISHPGLIPVFGPSPFQHLTEVKAAACELYESKEDKLLVVQFRTPFVSRHAPALHKFLAQTLKGARRVVVLSGCFAFEKRVIEDSPYEYCASQTFKEAHSAQLEKVPWKEFAGTLVFGGGNGMQLYRALEQENIPVVLLFRYLLDGDNSADAASIVKELNSLCQVFLEIPVDGQLKLIMPVSWNLLFGNDAPLHIFD